MTADGSVSAWIDQLKAGNADAAQQLWERYFDRLVRLARRQLQAAPRRIADEEDVALSVIDSLCRAAEQGKFPHLSDRDDLWHLLVTLTQRKATDLKRREGAEKRGGGRVRPASGLAGDDTTDDSPLAGVAGREPDPEFAVQVAEECERLLDQLGDQELRQIALAKLAGDTNEEIAARLDYALATVERRLRLIRTIWEERRPP
jgi:DNA-directed RNA polymerase specialized sigma24 family protein